MTTSIECWDGGAICWQVTKPVSRHWSPLLARVGFMNQVESGVATTCNLPRTVHSLAYLVSVKLVAPPPPGGVGVSWISYSRLISLRVLLAMPSCLHPRIKLSYLLYLIWQDRSKCDDVYSTWAYCVSVNLSLQCTVLGELSQAVQLIMHRLTFLIRLLIQVWQIWRWHQVCGWQRAWGKDER